MSNLEQQELNTLKKSAHRSFLVLLVLNISLSLLFLFTNSELFIFAVVIQVSIMILWLIPVFLFQVIYKKQPIWVSVYKSLISYRNIMEQVQWP